MSRRTGSVGRSAAGEGAGGRADAGVGFTGRNSLGPLLKSPPLTKSQLRELALNPELLMKSQR